MVLSSVLAEENEAQNQGGGIKASGSGGMSISIINGTFTDNTAASGSGRYHVIAAVIPDVWLSKLSTLKTRISLHPMSPLTAIQVAKVGSCFIRAILLTSCRDRITAINYQHHRGYTPLSTTVEQHLLRWDQNRWHGQCYSAEFQRALKYWARYANCG